ncbi:hypothetical protein BHE74_00012310 [Ensete ventricosum]|nr:hypothetical protein BHE74_00012310 [Ensete ventricosum]
MRFIEPPSLSATVGAFYTRGSKGGCTEVINVIGAHGRLGGDLDTEWDGVFVVRVVQSFVRACLIADLILDVPIFGTPWSSSSTPCFLPLGLFLIRSGQPPPIGPLFSSYSTTSSSSVPVVEGLSRVTEVAGPRPQAVDPFGSPEVEIVSSSSGILTPMETKALEALMLTYLFLFVLWTWLISKESWVGLQADLRTALRYHLPRKHLLGQRRSASLQQVRSTQLKGGSELLRKKKAIVRSLVRAPPPMVVLGSLPRGGIWSGMPLQGKGAGQGGR